MSQEVKSVLRGSQGMSIHCRLLDFQSRGALITH